MKRVLALIFALALGGCAAVTPDTTSSGSGLKDFLDRIQNVTIADAEAALADVHAHGDVDLAALQCLPAIEEFIKSSPVAPGTPDIKGVLSANQVKRDVMLGGITRNGPFQMALRKLHVACAAYVGDEARFAAEFAAMIGAASRGVPAIPPLVIGPAVPVQ